MTSYVYFVQAGEDGPIKVGFTAHAPSKRMVKLQSDCPFQIRLLGAIEGTLADEAALHLQLAGYLTQGEWFRPVPKVLEIVTAALESGVRWVEPPSRRKLKASQNNHPLLQWRLETNTTLRELGGRVGISVAALSRFETGRFQPGIETLPALVRETGIPAAKFRPDIAAIFCPEAAQ